MNDVGTMEAVISRWEGTGLSLRRYGAQNGISYSRLVYWRRKLRGGTARRKKAASKGTNASAELVPVRVVPDGKPSSPSPAQFTAWLANGVSIDVPAGFDEKELRSLVDILTSC